MKSINLTKTLIACSVIYSSTAFSQSPITGAGTTGYIPKFTATSTIANSIINESTTGMIGIGTNPLVGEFVSISKNQTSETRVGIRNLSSGLAFTSLNIQSLGVSANLASYHAAYTGVPSGMIKANTSVLNSSGNLNIGTLASTTTSLTLFTNNTARVTIKNTGEVGIGTTTPDKWFTVKSAVANTQIAKFADNTNYIGLGSNEVAAFDLAGNPANLYLGGQKLTILTSGNVGVGTPNPLYKLEVVGNAKVIGLESSVNQAFDYGFNEVLNVTRNLTKAVGVFNTADPINPEKFIVWGSGRTDIKATTKTDKYFVINDVSVSGSPVEALSIQGNGYTQYNVSNPTAMPNVIDVFDNTLTTNAKYLFRVKSNGHVYAREVEILNTTLGFPDYVFSKDYNLMPLSEVEKYIDSNKHLPGFEKGETYDQNGIKTSELIYKQQEKIEELTLYIIELEKRIKVIEESNKH